MFITPNYTSVGPHLLENLPRMLREVAEQPAATMIVTFAPSRKEFLPSIRAATISDDLAVRDFALEFFDEDADTDM